MEYSDYQMLVPIAIAITTFGGAWLTIRRIARDAERSKKEQKAEILQSAKEEINLLKTHLEAKIKAVSVELKNVEQGMERDIDHFKEIYNGEIRNLGNKIEDLRVELRNQHSQLIDLLTEMVKNKD